MLLELTGFQIYVCSTQVSYRLNYRNQKKMAQKTGITSNRLTIHDMGELKGTFGMIESAAQRLGSCQTSLGRSFLTTQIRTHPWVYLSLVIFCLIYCFIIMIVLIRFYNLIIYSLIKIVLNNGKPDVTDTCTSPSTAIISNCLLSTAAGVDSF